MKKEDKEYVIMSIKEMLGGHYNLYKKVWGEDHNPEDDICRTQLEKALKIIEGLRIMNLKEGMKIKFLNEKQRYTVQCFNERYVICTKPFNPKKTVLYTIIDFEENIRGAENLIFSMGFETKEQCQEALERLSKRETEVSYRNRRNLDIESIS